MERMDAKALAELKSALEAHRSAQRESYLKERLFKNKEFHLTLASISGKETQMRILQNLFDILFLKYGGNYLPVSSLQSVDEEHQQIYDCIVRKDAKKARSIIAGHVSSVKRQGLMPSGRCWQSRNDRNSDSHHHIARRLREMDLKQRRVYRVAAGFASHGLHVRRAPYEHCGPPAPAGRHRGDRGDL